MSTLCTARGTIFASAAHCNSGRVVASLAYVLSLSAPKLCATKAGANSADITAHGLQVRRRNQRNWGQRRRRGLEGLRMRQQDIKRIAATEVVHVTSPIGDPIGSYAPSHASGISTYYLAVQQQEQRALASGTPPSGDLDTTLRGHTERPRSQKRGWALVSCILYT